MKKTMQFRSYAEYETWAERFDEYSEYEDVPVFVDNGWEMTMDIFTECKSWKVALRRFVKAFSHIDGQVSGWIEGIKESCECGCFEDKEGWRPAWTYDPKEIEEIAKDGIYAWEVEQIDDGRWYIFLKISGCYAGREKTA